MLGEGNSDCDAQEDAELEDIAACEALARSDTLTPPNIDGNAETLLEGDALLELVAVALDEKLAVAVPDLECALLLLTLLLLLGVGRALADADAEKDEDGDALPGGEMDAAGVELGDNKALIDEETKPSNDVLPRAVGDGKLDSEGLAEMVWVPSGVENIDACGLGDDTCDSSADEEADG